VEVYSEYRSRGVSFSASFIQSNSGKKSQLRDDANGKEESKRRKLDRGRGLIRLI